MAADIIDFEHWAGLIKNAAATRRLAEEFAGSQTLEQQAIEIMNVAVVEDTAPSEYCAPESDPA